MSDKDYSLSKAILWGGLIAGTIDIGAAALISGTSLERILQAVASGMLGQASFKGGMHSALLGLVLQWVMSVFIAANYALVSGFLPWMRRRWVGGGLAYGVVVFAVMNYVVVPLSAVGRLPKFTAFSFVGNLLAMLLFGLIIAFFARSPAGAPTSAVKAGA